MDRPQNDLDKGAANPNETAKQVVDQVQQTISEAGTEAQQKVSQASAEALRTVSDTSRKMRESAYAVKETASTSLLNAAENIRREAVKGGNEDMIRQAHRLARSMEKAAVYLDSHTFDQIGEAAAETVKENPWQSLGIAFVIGLIIGLLFSGSSRD